MIQYLAERGPRLGHGFRSLLTQADAMTLARTFQKHTLRIVVGREVVAGHRVPPEAAIDIKTRSFSPFAQIRGFSRRQVARPTRGITPAVIASHGKIRIRLMSHADIFRACGCGHHNFG